MPRLREVRQAGAQSNDVEREFLCAMLQFLAHGCSIPNSHFGSRNCNPRYVLPPLAGIAHSSGETSRSRDSRLGPSSPRRVLDRTGGTWRAGARNIIFQLSKIARMISCACFHGYCRGVVAASAVDAVAWGGNGKYHM